MLISVMAVTFGYEYIVAKPDQVSLHLVISNKAILIPFSFLLLSPLTLATTGESIAGTLLDAIFAQVGIYLIH